MSDFLQENYTYELELQDIEKALAVVQEQIEGLRLGKDESHLIAQLWGVLDSIEETLGVYR